MKSPFAVTVFLLLALVSLPLSAQRQPAPGALASAFAVGDLREADRLLGLGADPDQPDATGQTPLCYAVDSGRMDLLERILATTADPDLPGRDGRTPLMIAIVKSREDMLLKLLAAGADPGRISDTLGPENDPVPASPLSVAINRGYFDTARRLFHSGADPRRLKYAGDDGYDPLNLPVLSVPVDAGVWKDMGDIRDSADSPDWDASAGGTLLSLQRAARDNDWRAARDSLDAGADVDAADERGVTALMAASWHGNASMVSLFLQRGADPAVVDNRGRTALSYAAAAGSLNCQEILLTSFEADEADRPLDDIDQSPLYYALVFGGRRSLEGLLDAGIRPVGTDGGDVNLLMLAAWMGDLRTVRLLLPMMDGGDRDREGRTALAWAAAAFDRDRRADRESGIDRQGGDIYALARILAARTRNPAVYATQPTRDLVISGIDAAEAWSPGMNPSAADMLRRLNPPPVPAAVGDGDLTLYRIFRDEEPGIPAAD